MKRLKVGVIGCGVMGGFHIKQYLNIPEVELIGASDIDEARAPKDVRFFKNYRELSGLCDAVSITTPTATHFDVGSYALDAGCNILIEKPITLKIDQAEKLIKKARSKKLVLAVGHIESFNPAFKAVLREIKGSKPDVIDIRRYSPFPERITDVSCVIDMMVHDIDLAMRLAKSKVKYVNAIGKKVRSDKLDQTLAVIVFENGTVANIEANRVYDEKLRKLIVACGSRAYEADLLNKKADEIEAGKKRKIQVELSDQLNQELRDFVNAVMKRKKPSVTGEDGLAALEIAQRIEEAAIKA